MHGYIFGKFISVVFDRSYMIGNFNRIKERERRKLDKDAMTAFFVSNKKHGGQGILIIHFINPIMDHFWSRKL